MHRRPARSPLGVMSLVLFLVTTTSVVAQPKLGCGLAAQPGASLLLPYFEVERDDPDGRTTFFALGNTDTETTLARAVVWTNWGHPVLAFDLAIEPGAVRTFNVRDLLGGQLPATEPPAPFDGRYGRCTSPITLPPVRPENLQNLLAGQPRVADGLCYAEAIDGGRLLTGYITVDGVNDCSGRFGITPRDPGYFGDCASGLASNDNVLWGDFFLVDAAGNHAQGERLVPLVADQTAFGNDVCIDPPCGIRNPVSFWHPEGNRMPLPSAYETRFLNGGGFDGGTELIVWAKGQVGPDACGSTTPSGVAQLEIEARDERGQALGTQIVESRLLTRRLQVGGDEVPIVESFGCLGIAASGRQLWVMPLMNAEQRFGVGLSATPVADFCSF
ncbi:MAG: hypothetical protein AAGE94_10870 [Acidobacteriota bacterium]